MLFHCAAFWRLTLSMCIIGCVSFDQTLFCSINSKLSVVKTILVFREPDSELYSRAKSCFRIKLLKIPTIQFVNRTYLITSESFLPFYSNHYEHFNIIAFRWRKPTALSLAIILLPPSLSIFINWQATGQLNGAIQIDTPCPTYPFTKLFPISIVFPKIYFLFLIKSSHSRSSLKSVQSNTLCIH